MYAFYLHIVPTFPPMLQWSSRSFLLENKFLTYLGNWIVPDFFQFRLFLLNSNFHAYLQIVMCYLVPTNWNFRTCYLIVNNFVLLLLLEFKTVVSSVLPCSVIRLLIHTYMNLFLQIFRMLKILYLLKIMYLLFNHIIVICMLTVFTVV